MKDGVREVVGGNKGWLKTVGVDFECEVTRELWMVSGGFWVEV